MFVVDTYDVIVIGAGHAGGELAERLAALYDYMSDRLLYANLHNSQPALDEVAGLLATLREAWAEIRSQVQPASV